MSGILCRNRIWQPKNRKSHIGNLWSRGLSHFILASQWLDNFSSLRGHLLELRNSDSFWNSWKFDGQVGMGQTWEVSRINSICGQYQLFCGCLGLKFDPYPAFNVRWQTSSPLHTVVCFSWHVLYRELRGCFIVRQTANQLDGAVRNFKMACPI